MDKIILTGMDFFGTHGCLPEERRQGQHFLVDITMLLELEPAGLSDDLSETVNYAAVFETIRRIVEGNPLNLIEALAERIAGQVLQDYLPVQEVEITVHKPAAPIPGNFRDAAVCITRRR